MSCLTYIIHISHMCLTATFFSVIKSVDFLMQIKHDLESSWIFIPVSTNICWNIHDCLESMWPFLLLFVQSSFSFTYIPSDLIFSRRKSHFTAEVYLISVCCNHSYSLTHCTLSNHNKPKRIPYKLHFDTTPEGIHMSGITLVTFFLIFFSLSRVLITTVWR